MKIFYLGSFPPPYGGVTVKNKYLFQSLYESIGEHIEKIDTQAIKRNPVLLFPACFKWLRHPPKRLIVATAGTQRRRITMFLNRFRPSMLNGALLMVMGGNFAEMIADDVTYCHALQKYRMIYVETQGMIDKLKALGIVNTAIFPNCRKRPEMVFEVHANADQELKCVFFSQVSVEKGIDIVLEAAKRLTNVHFDIWGDVQSSCQQMVQDAISQLTNVTYRGIYKVEGDNVYTILNQYDLLLFLTRWKTEGVPGVLVEGKIAGLPAIVSNVSYNAEIVEDGVSGIVLKENMANELAETISGLDKDRKLLYALKRGAKRSAKDYYIENYMGNILQELYMGGVILKGIISITAVCYVLPWVRLSIDLNGQGTHRHLHFSLLRFV